MKLKLTAEVTYLKGSKGTASIPNNSRDHEAELAAKLSQILREAIADGWLTGDSEIRVVRVYNKPTPTPRKRDSLPTCIYSTAQSMDT